MTQSKLQRSEHTGDDQEWIEKVGKTAYDLACIELAIKEHLETMPSNLLPTFQQMLDDIKARKDNLERS